MGVVGQAVAPCEVADAAEELRDAVFAEPEEEYAGQVGPLLTYFLSLLVDGNDRAGGVVVGYAVG